MVPFTARVCNVSLFFFFLSKKKLSQLLKILVLKVSKSRKQIGMSQVLQHACNESFSTLGAWKTSIAYMVESFSILV